MTDMTSSKDNRKPRIEDPGTFYLPRIYGWHGWKAFRKHEDEKKPKDEQ